MREVLLAEETINEVRRPGASETHDGFWPQNTSQLVKQEVWLPESQTVGVSAKVGCRENRSWHQGKKRI